VRVYVVVRVVVIREDGSGGEGDVQLAVVHQLDQLREVPLKGGAGGSTRKEAPQKVYGDGALRHAAHVEPDDVGGRATELRVHKLQCVLEDVGLRPLAPPQMDACLLWRILMPTPPPHRTQLAPCARQGLVHEAVEEPAVHAVELCWRGGGDSEELGVRVQIQRVQVGPLRPAGVAGERAQTDGRQLGQLIQLHDDLSVRQFNGTQRLVQRLVLVHSTENRSGQLGLDGSVEGQKSSLLRL